MKFARIVSNKAVDARTESPEGYFTPEIAAEFVEVPDEVEDGWICDQDGKWSAPPVPVPTPDPVTTYPTVGPIHFQMLFTIHEMVAVTEKQTNDPILAAFWSLIQDPRTDKVDLSLKSVQDAVEYTLTAIAVEDVATRKAAILSGVLT